MQASLKWLVFGLALLTSANLIICKKLHQPAWHVHRQAQVRELPPDTSAIRSPMDMPDWYRERLQKSAEMAKSQDRQVPRYIRGYWLVDPKTKPSP